MHWLIVHLSQELGISNSSSRAYDFWSGSGSDIGEIAIIGAVVGVFRKHNCHIKGCYRIGKHPLENSPFILCKKHHPDVPNKGLTVDQI
jgi:hypothetical protein